MAHECLVCGSWCHCNGDIDDCLLNDDEDVDNCDHCLGKDGDEDEYELDTDCGEVEPEGR